MEKQINLFDNEGFWQKCEELIKKYDIKDLRLVLRKESKVPHIPFLKYTAIKDPYIKIGVFSELAYEDRKRIDVFPLVYILEQLEEEERPIRKGDLFAIKPLPFSIDGILLTYDGDVKLYVDTLLNAYPFTPVPGKWTIGYWKIKGRWPEEDKAGKFSDAEGCAWREEPPMPLISMKDFIEDKSGAYEIWFAKIIRPKQLPKKLLFDPVFYSPSRGLIPWEEIVSQLREFYNERKN